MPRKFLIIAAAVAAAAVAYFVWRRRAGTMPGGVGAAAGVGVSTQAAIATLHAAPAAHLGAAALQYGANYVAGRIDPVGAGTTAPAVATNTQIPTSDCAPGYVGWGTLSDGSRTWCTGQHTSFAGAAAAAVRAAAAAKSYNPNVGYYG